MIIEGPFNHDRLAELNYNYNEDDEKEKMREEEPWEVYADLMRRKISMISLSQPPTPGYRNDNNG